MNAARFIYDDTGRLRTPWRIVLFLLVVFATATLGAIIEGAVDEFVESRGYLPIISDWSLPLAILAATALLLRWVDGLPWSYIGLDRRAADPRAIGFATLLAFLAIAVPSFLLLASDQLEMVDSRPGSWWLAAGISFANLFPSAFAEELLLRGYVFVVLLHAIGWKWTLISTSIVFGLLHVYNPGADAQSIAIVIMAGFFLGAIFLATRSLWAVTAAHFIWNWFMAAILHSPVSGIPIAAPDYRVIDSGEDWLTGGAWGPEGGFAAALGMFAGMIYLFARPLRRMER